MHGYELTVVCWSICCRLVGLAFRVNKRGEKKKSKNSMNGMRGNQTLELGNITAPSEDSACAVFQIRFFHFVHPKKCFFFRDKNGGCMRFDSRLVATPVSPVSTQHHHSSHWREEQKNTWKNKPKRAIKSNKGNPGLQTVIYAMCFSYVFHISLRVFAHHY